jgi:hypothetical protein
MSEEIVAELLTTGRLISVTPRSSNAATHGIIRLDDGTELPFNIVEARPVQRGRLMNSDPYGIDIKAEFDRDNRDVTVKTYTFKGELRILIWGFTNGYQPS